MPTTTGAAGQLASFGTLIILDGVPLSNNANLKGRARVARSSPPLQQAGNRPSAHPGGGTRARGGDSRRPLGALRRPDAGEQSLSRRGLASSPRSSSVASIRVLPRPAWPAGGLSRAAGTAPHSPATSHAPRSPQGLRDADVWRASFDVAHRLTRVASGAGAFDDPAATGFVLDTRLNVFQVYRNEPEQPTVRPGLSSSDRSGGFAAFRARAPRPPRPSPPRGDALGRSRVAGHPQPAAPPSRRGAVHRPPRRGAKHGAFCGRALPGSGAARRGTVARLFARRRGDSRGTPAWRRPRCVRGRSCAASGTLGRATSSTSSSRRR